jgi:hypothetical protein
MKEVLKEAAWLTALIALGFASIMIDANVGFPALFEFMLGSSREP